MLNLLQNKNVPIFLRRVELFCLFVACSYTSMEATVLSCHFSWVWSCMSKVLWNNKLPISLEWVEWFCWFFALHLVICILLDIHWSYKNMLFWVGTVRHRLSANQFVSCFKLNRAYSSSFLRAIIARNHLPFFKIFSNFVHFCPNFQIFCPFLNFFVLFCPFSEKSHACPYF